MIEILIKLLHLTIILYVLTVPFTNVVALNIVNVSLTLCLMIHWYFNNNLCSLSLIESKLSGVSPSETFMHRLVSPIYDISESKLNIIIWFITIFSLLSLIHI